MSINHCLVKKLPHYLDVSIFWIMYTTNQTLSYFFQVWNIRIQYSKTITRSFSKVSSILQYHTKVFGKVSTRSLQESVRKWLDSFRVLCPHVAKLVSSHFTENILRHFSVKQQHQICFYHHINKVCWMCRTKQVI